MTNPIDPSQNSAISQTDYLKLFMQELSYQDPLKPVDNREFMVQMAEFSALQEARTSSESLKLLSSIASANQSLMLLGKQVQLANTHEQGRVHKIHFPDGEPPLLLISINGNIVEKNLTEISDVMD